MTIMFNNLWRKISSNICYIAIKSVIYFLLLNSYMIFCVKIIDGPNSGICGQLAYFFSIYMPVTEGVQPSASWFKIVFMVIIIASIAFDSLVYIEKKNINESQFYLYRCKNIEDYYKMQLIKITKMIGANLIIFLAIFIIAMITKNLVVLPVNIGVVVILINIYLLVAILIIFIYIILNIKKKYIIVVFFMIEFVLPTFNKIICKYVFTQNIKNGIIGTISLILLLGICYALRNIRRNSLEF